MLNNKPRAIAVLVAIVAVAFVVAGWFGALGSVLTWSAFALIAAYLAWHLLRRSQYAGKPGDMHLNS